MKKLTIIASLFCVGCTAGAKENSTQSNQYQAQRPNVCGVVSSDKSLKSNEKYFLNSIKKFTWTSVDGGSFKAVVADKDAGN